MLKFLFDVFQIAILLRIIWAVGKYILKRKKRRSIIMYKTKKILSNWIEIKLDRIISKQKQKKTAVRTQQQPSGNIVPIAMYRKQSKAK